MNKTILVDGMHCIYDEEFNVNQNLLNILNSINCQKILVVNKFREKGLVSLQGNEFEAFSLEEQGIKKNNPEFFKTLMTKFSLTPENLIYFDHSEDNINSAKELGIKSIHYTGDNDKIKEFLDELKIN